MSTKKLRKPKKSLNTVRSSEWHVSNSANLSYCRCHKLALLHSRANRNTGRGRFDHWKEANTAITAVRQVPAKVQVQRGAERSAAVQASRRDCEFVWRIHSPQISQHSGLWLERSHHSAALELLDAIRYRPQVLQDTRGHCKLCFRSVDLTSHIRSRLTRAQMCTVKCWVNRRWLTTWCWSSNSASSLKWI